MATPLNYFRDECRVGGMDTCGKLTRRTSNSMLQVNLFQDRTGQRSVSRNVCRFIDSNTDDDLFIPFKDSDFDSFEAAAPELNINIDRCCLARAVTLTASDGQTFVVTFGVERDLRVGARTSSLNHVFNVSRNDCTTHFDGTQTCNVVTWQETVTASGTCNNELWSTSNATTYRHLGTCSGNIWVPASVAALGPPSACAPAVIGPANCPPDKIHNQTWWVDNAAAAPVITNITCADGQAGTSTQNRTTQVQRLCFNGATSSTGSTQIINNSAPVVSCPPPIVNGVCNAATNGQSFTGKPTSSLCGATGTATTVLPASGSGPWNWSCQGTNGASSADDASCSAHQRGSCGSAHGTTVATLPSGAALCATGTASAVGGPLVGPWTWSCSGSNGGASSDDVACTANTTNCAPAGSNYIWNGLNWDDFGMPAWALNWVGYTSATTPVAGANVSLGRGINKINNGQMLTCGSPSYTGTWTISGCGTCSGACNGGAGTYTCTIGCSTGNVANCNPATRPSPTQSCTNSTVCPPVYTGTWTTGTYGACSGACGGGSGTQTRSVTCSTGNDANCNPATKPATSTGCTNSTACPPACTNTQVHTQLAYWQGTARRGLVPTTSASTGVSSITTTPYLSAAQCSAYGVPSPSTWCSSAGNLRLALAPSISDKDLIITATYTGSLGSISSPETANLHLASGAILNNFNTPALDTFRYNPIGNAWQDLGGPVILTNTEMYMPVFDGATPILNSVRIVKVETQCLPPCQANAARNISGQCVCNVGYEAWSGQCLTNCPSNEIRNLSTGVCGPITHRWQVVQPSGNCYASPPCTSCRSIGSGCNTPNATGYSTPLAACGPTGTTAYAAVQCLPF